MYGKKMNQNSKNRIGCKSHATGKPSNSSLSPFPKPSGSLLSPFPTPTSSVLSPFPKPTSSALSPFPKPSSSALSPFPKSSSTALSPFPKPSSTALSPFPKPSSSPLSPFSKPSSSPLSPFSKSSTSGSIPFLKTASAGWTPFSKPAKMPGTEVEDKISIDECPIPHIKIQENALSLPRYAAIALRSADEPIAMDELDALQLELESLLCTNELRSRYFQSELDSIDSNEPKLDRKGKAAGKQPQYPVKRKFSDDKPLKSKDFTKLSNLPKTPKYRNFSTNTGPSRSSQDPYSADLINSDKVELSQLALPKNTIPYKFWNSVEPYCASVTLDDIKFLETLLAQSSNTTLPPIPPLGRHYSEVWADEQLAVDQQASTPNKSKSSDMSLESVNLRKKVEKPPETVITGPLTQRLVSALVEEEGTPYEVPDIKVKSNSTAKTSYKDSLTLEKCLRKELVEQGILDPEDLSPLTDPADDEILAEIKKLQTELTAVKRENCRNLKHLIGVSKQEVKRVNMKKQLDSVDMDCIHIYKKMVAAKQKKRPITKKEKDDAWKAINDQIRLNKEISALPITGPNSS